MEEIESAGQAETPAGESPESAAEPLAAVTAEELLPGAEPAPEPPADQTRLKAVLEAIIYVTEEPLTRSQIASALGASPELAGKLLAELTLEYEKPEHGLAVREVAGGYKMATKAEHHEAVRAFVRSLKAPLKLSLAALETLAVIAYKQPVTTPEVLEIRGVQGAGVMKTLLERKLIAASGRKNVIGKPVLYKTTKEFLIQFGLKDLSELPSLKEFEEIRRMSIPEPEEAAPASEPAAETPGDEAGQGGN
ncbi:MAG TPA: SMC-Scp complex subunit ScpB [Bryobacteraceae bacterium]|nr:SMC-Scp complex subunit ScpB [Bryobacteraceae bacterium]